jgi:acyl-coenzyme A thioesterase PaaI-like protein
VVTNLFERRDYDEGSGRSVGTFLGMAMREETEPGGPVRVDATVLARPAVRAADGSIHGGALITMCDCIGGFCGGLGALPDGWVVTTNLMLRSSGAPVAAPLEFRTEVLRRGRSSVVTSVVAHDADGAFVVAGTITSAVLVPAGGVPHWDRPARLALVEQGAEDTMHYEDWVGARPTATGVVVELVDELRNPWGMMHGGVTGAIVDRAARHVSGATTTTDVVLHYLAPARVGPVVATATVRGRRPDGTVVAVEIRDAGNDDRLVAVAITTVR